jgi:RNA polymerase sigma-70 factor (ECF subfamily)
MAVRVSELGNGAAKAGNGHAGAALGSYEDLDDRMLVLDFQAGNNDEAFAEIHRRYCGLARHVCQRILRNPEDADEATQEAMLRVYQGLPRFNGRYALQPWVARIATNVSLDVTRARARRPLTGDQALSDLHEDLHERCEDPQEAVERAVDREQITRVLEELPDHYREVLVLREFEGRSHKEIGEAMGVTPSQAKALIYRAKGSFRRAWNGGKGLQAFLLLLVALAKVPQLIKKLIQPAQELAATSTAAPAATASVVTTGERVTAAAVAVLVAGSAAIGAVALKHPQPSNPSPPPSTLVAPVTAPEPVAPRDHRVETRAKEKLIPALVEIPSVVPSPSPSVSPSGSPSPSPTPAPEPIGFILAFASDVTTDVRCGCGASPVLTGTVTGSDERISSFSATVDQAGAADSTGAIAWPLWLEQSSPDGQHHDMTFTLTTPDGPYRYTAQGSLVSAKKTGWGGWTYVFQGTYSFYSGPAAPDGTVPGYGTYRAAVSMSWRTSRVVDASVTLIENVPSPTATPTPTPTPSASPTP